MSTPMPQPNPFKTLGSFFDLNEGRVITAFNVLLAKLDKKYYSKDPLPCISTLMPILVTKIISPYKIGAITTQDFINNLRAEIKTQFLTPAAPEEWCTDEELILAWNSIVELKLPSADNPTGTAQMLADLFKGPNANTVITTYTNELNQLRIAELLGTIGFDYNPKANVPIIRTRAGDTGSVVIPVMLSYKSPINLHLQEFKNAPGTADTGIRVHDALAKIIKATTESQVSECVRTLEARLAPRSANTPPISTACAGAAHQAADVAPTMPRA